MKCPHCGHGDQRVLDTRPTRDESAIWRRRECVGCGKRFTTFEQPEHPRLFVIKRNSGREEFNREKLLNSVVIACRKRPISIERLRELSVEIEKELSREFVDEAPSYAIGELVMEHLKDMDTVAFVRFASVYRDFQTASDFREIVEAMRKEEAALRSR